jgi:Ca2+-binding EF-hand superfamily protein
LGGITFEDFLKALDVDRARKERKDTIRRVYRKYDKKNRGFIQYDDLKQVVAKELQEDIDDDVLREVRQAGREGSLKIFSRTDSNKDGKLTFEDFYNVMTKRVYY